MRDATEIRQEFVEALLSIDRVHANRLASEWANAHGSEDFVDQIIVPSMEKIGTDWEAGRVALSQIYMSGRICSELVEELLPQSSGSSKGHPPIAICVFEDYHMLGERIVYAYLRSAGFDVIDYGRVNEAELLERIQADKISLLFISVLMLPSALRIEGFMRSLKARVSKPRVVVGGAPFRLDESLWTEIGVDGMGTTASDAVQFAHNLLAETR